MKIDTEITLIGIENSFDNWGNTIKNENKTHILAKMKSASQSEFYQASSQGFKPEVVFELYKIQYNQEPYIEHEGIRYSVIRTYSNTLDKLEIVCQRKLTDE